MKRALSGLLAVLLAANALAMLFASLWWYGAVPGVTATGPFNPHFVRDIGATYLTVALGLGWFAARPAQGWPALVAAAVFLDLHALIHVHDAALSPVCGHDLLRDFPGVFLPALIATTLAAFPKTKSA
ncbi:hypothetical protein [Phenylobacterium montanum]|uniref:DUF4345 domain-containing protein n=1 Tax=Phenylobacterium montanum TaxID=2823693 RepID=A0A975G2Y3_9CAUL|nr:hypothetical protein [Caulobacter sp. S6]QUD89920.1 hypothetical protein KCG34_08670 [Caulobacter sp. S6]